MSDPTETTETARPQRTGAGVRKFVFAMLVFGVFWLVFGQAIPRIVFPLVQQLPPPAAQPPAAPAPAAEATPTQLSILEERIANLEARIANSPASGEDVAKQNERIAQLEEKLASLSLQLGSVESTQTRQLALLGAMVPLKDAIGRGEPFAASLMQLERLAKGSSKATAALDTLVPYAEQGVPTLTMLQQQFDASVTAALSGHEPGWSGVLQSLVRIRKVGEQTGSDNQAVIARAERTLAANNIDATIKELSGLSAPAAESFAGWIDHAKAYLQAHAAIDALQNALTDDSPDTKPTAKPAPSDTGL